MVKPGGTIITNSDLVDSKGAREDVTIVEVPCLSIAEELKNPRGANIIMVGAIARVMEDFTMQEAIDGMNDMFRKKGKEKFEAQNTIALERGYRLLDK